MNFIRAVVFSMFVIATTSFADGQSTPKFSGLLRISNLSKSSTEIKLFNECFFERKSDVSLPVRSVQVVLKSTVAELKTDELSNEVRDLITKETVLGHDVLQYFIEAEPSVANLEGSAVERCRVRLFVRDLSEDVDEDGEVMAPVELSYELFSTSDGSEVVADPAKFADLLTRSLGRIVVRREAKQRRFVVFRAEDSVKITP